MKLSIKDFFSKCDKICSHFFVQCKPIKELQVKCNSEKLPEPNPASLIQ